MKNKLNPLSNTPKNYVLERGKKMEKNQYLSNQKDGDGFLKKIFSSRELKNNFN